MTVFIVFLTGVVNSRGLRFQGVVFSFLFSSGTSADNSGAPILTNSVLLTNREKLPIIHVLPGTKAKSQKKPRPRVFRYFPHVIQQKRGVLLERYLSPRLSL